MAATPTVSLAQKSYTVTDLGTGVARGISNSTSNPYVVGIDGNTPRHAFRWRNGARIDLGTFDGSGESTAYAVNTAGQVVGSCGGGGSEHAFFWQDDNGNGQSDPGEMQVWARWEARTAWPSASTNQGRL